MISISSMTSAWRPRMGIKAPAKKRATFIVDVSVYAHIHGTTLNRKMPKPTFEPTTATPGANLRAER